MFFKDDFNHLSPNANDNFFILNEKFKKFLRKGSKEQLQARLEKKEKRLKPVEERVKALQSIVTRTKQSPDDPVLGQAGLMLPYEQEVREYGHLRDIQKIKEKLAEQMLPKEGKNTLDLDFQEKQKKKDEQKENKVEKLIQKIDDDADQTHL
jgi:hypothetical protein